MIIIGSSGKSVDWFRLGKITRSMMMRGLDADTVKVVIGQGRDGVSRIRYSLFYRWSTLQMELCCRMAKGAS